VVVLSFFVDAIIVLKTFMHLYKNVLMRRHSMSMTNCKLQSMVSCSQYLCCPSTADHSESCGRENAEMLAIKILFEIVICNKKLSRCWDSTKCKPLDALEVQNPTFSISHWFFSVKFKITGYYDPCHQDPDLSCRADFHFLLHFGLWSVHQCYRQMDGCHACSISATCKYRIVLKKCCIVAPDEAVAIM